MADGKVVIETDLDSSGIEKGEGLIAPRVALCAAHEANLIIELILKNCTKQRKEVTENEQ